MNVEQRTLGGVTILDLEGRMTIESLERPVRATVRRLLSEGRKHFLLNMDGVPYVDSTGLAEIMEAYLTTTRQGGMVKLEHLSRRAHEMLKVTGLLTVLEVFDSETAPLAGFAPPSP